MTGKDIWDAATYLQFGDERLRPALDLIARIPHAAPKLVVDLGCGAGNALPVLAARFPGARVMGVDGSAAMLTKAAAAGFATEQADISSWVPQTPADVIFSNAALQWLGGPGAEPVAKCAATAGRRASAQPPSAGWHVRSMRCAPANTHRGKARA